MSHCLKLLEIVFVFLFLALVSNVGCSKDEPAEVPNEPSKVEKKSETRFNVIPLPAEVPEGLSLIQPRRISSTSAEPGHLPVSLIDNNPRSFWVARKDDAAPVVSFEYETRKAKPPILASGAMVRTSCGPSSDYQAARSIRIVKKAVVPVEGKEINGESPKKVVWETTLKATPSEEARFFTFGTALSIEQEPGKPIEITAEIRGDAMGKDARPVCLADLLLFSGKAVTP